MKKERENLGLVTLVIILALFLTPVFVVSEETIADMNKSETCLLDMANSKLNSGMTMEELTFSLMALSYDKAIQQKLVSKIEEQKNPNAACWPKASCTLKETAQVLLAYNSIGKDTSALENWLKNQSMAASELTWYLEIESNNKTTCTIKYDSLAPTITMLENKKITGNAGTCFRAGYNGYWLEVLTPCFGKEFTISCTDAFLTTLLYKRKTGSTIFVSSLTKTGDQNGETKEKIQSYCFKQAGSCNYEGSLWATIALDKKAIDIQAYIPYLISLASENQRYLPSAFLYSLTNYNEYLTELSNLQNKQGYWQASDNSRKYYDTGMALLSLYGRSSEQAELAKTYLFQPTIQGKGCWNNNLRDTALILYAINPKTPASGDINPITRCNDYSAQGYQCLTPNECNLTGGSNLPNFFCSGINIVCCNKQKVEKSCSELGGKICTSNQECTVELISAKSTTNCCPAEGTCEEKPEPQQTECERASTEYSCSLSNCEEGYEENNYECESGFVCCQVKQEPSKWWIWLLIILIILLLLAIWKRNQLKVWMFRVKSNFSKKPIEPEQRRSPFPTNMPPRYPIPSDRRIIPGAMPPRPMPFQPPKNFPKDKELDETMKKLKDMSK